MLKSENSSVAHHDLICENSIDKISLKLVSYVVNRRLINGYESQFNKIIHNVHTT